MIEILPGQTWLYAEPEHHEVQAGPWYARWTDVRHIFVERRARVLQKLDDGSFLVEFEGDKVGTVPAYFFDDRMCRLLCGPGSECTRKDLKAELKEAQQKICWLENELKNYEAVKAMNKPASGGA